MDVVYVVLGFIILLLAGDVLVKGAVNLALRLGIPALIVSLTVVSFGTSAPELFISVGAVLDDVPGIALGNVVGSNVANVLMVLGVPAIIAGIQCANTDTQRSFYVMLGVTVVFIVGCFFGPLRWYHGLVFLSILAWILWDQACAARDHRNGNAAAEEPGDAAEDDLEGADPEIPGWRIGLFLALGLVGLPFGADLLVDSSVNIAMRYGLSEEVIGLTLVAVGTSLPELATTVMAAVRRHTEVALGNVIGSNIFNLLAIIGTATLFGAIPVAEAFLRVDLWVMLAASLCLIPFVVFRCNISRIGGVALTALYVAYVAFLLT